MMAAMSTSALVLVGLLLAAPAQVVVPGQAGAPYAVGGLTAAGNAVYFSASDAAHGRELWRSDGTAFGTARVADLLRGPDSGDPTALVAWQSGIAFVAADGTGGTTLYRSDGTAEGTEPLMPLGDASWFHPPALAVQGPYLLFASAAFGAWRTDGTIEGTTALAIPPDGQPIVARVDAGASFSLITFDVSSECCRAYQVVRADPSAYAPLVSLWSARGLGPDPQPTDFVAVGSRIAFAGQGSIHWTDGETAVSIPIALDNLGYDARVSDLTRLGDEVVFAVSGVAERRGLWISDGTVEGTRRIAVFSEIESPLAMGTQVLFNAREANEPWGLWRADANGATRLRDMFAANLIGAGRGAVFSRVSASPLASELWASDGTAAGTGRIQVLPDASLSQFTVAGDRLFFTLSSDDAAGSLWTASLADLVPFVPPPCAGDCNGDASVAVDEVITGIAAALGAGDGGRCLAQFCHADCAGGPGIGRPTIGCLVAAVGALLNGCPVDRCSTDADCDDGNGCSTDQCTVTGCANSCICV